MDIDWPSLESMIVQAADAISAARPGEPVDSPLPTEKTREVLLPFSVMGETLLGAEWARVDRQQGQRGHHTLVGLRGTGRTGYRYNWLR